MKSRKSHTKFAFLLSTVLSLATVSAFTGFAADGETPKQEQNTTQNENATSGSESTPANQEASQSDDQVEELANALQNLVGDTPADDAKNTPKTAETSEFKEAPDTPNTKPNTDTTATAPAGDQPAVDPTQGGIEVSKFDTVSLNVQNTDLANVLQLLSIQSKRNIVPSPKVAGTVTANLYDVTFHEALDAILQQNGAGFIEKGNFIFVYTIDELKTKEEAEKKVTHRLFELNYITSTDAATFIQPLISGAGSVVAQAGVGAGIQPTVADVGANSSAHNDRLMIRDYPENVEMIAEVIKQLDIRPKQVLIESTILKADVNEDLQFGVDMAILADVGVNESVSGDPLNMVNEMITGGTQVKPSGAVISNPGNVQSGKGALKVGVLTKNVAVFVRALDEVTDTTIVANPKIMTLNKQRAEVLVGEKLGYLSTTATATATTQTVEFLDTGTQLTVRPFINSDGTVRMELKPSISSAETRDVVTGSSVVTIPDEVTQELITNVMVRDGQTVVLGGLFKEETVMSRNQVPFLGDVPILGNAFKGRGDDYKRSEVIFLVTPHVMRDEVIGKLGSSVKDSIEMRRIGARNALLPWSRSKMSSSHLRDALQHIESKNVDGAMWEVDLALDLNPTMVEAIRLKEKLTSRRQYIDDGSILQGVISTMIEDHSNLKRNDVRKRPMSPAQRPSEPASDGEKIAGTFNDEKLAGVLPESDTAEFNIDSAIEEAWLDEAWAEMVLGELNLLSEETPEEGAAPEDEPGTTTEPETTAEVETKEISDAGTEGSTDDPEATAAAGTQEDE